MKEFQINEFLKLRLENGKTNIYIKDKLFRQCKFLLINIDGDNIENFEDISSIDEAESRLDQSLEEIESVESGLLPEEGFWAHCSNLEAWTIHKYDTRLLHRTLAFPMLKALTDVGDLVAKAVFKEEIISRFESGYPAVVQYLIKEGFIRNYVKEELIETLLEVEEVDILRNLELFSKTELKIVEKLDMFYGGSQFAVEFDKNKLCGLELRHLNLQCFPLGITQLASLKKLLLERNMLKEIPKEIEKLKDLKELNLNGNQLEALPEAIGSLTSLKCLLLNNNKFKEFPKCVTKLTNLKYLGLGMNMIADIPDTIGNLKNLEMLALNHNKISNLPKGLKKLKSLKLLYLQNNRIETLPDMIEGKILF